jgi:NADPH:quinone reductase-like Zn-dependent oxidoreductase
MTAVALREFGAREVLRLEEVPAPSPGPGGKIILKPTAG